MWRPRWRVRSVLSTWRNDIFIPILKCRFKKIADCHLPPEAHSCRVVVDGVRKTHPGDVPQIRQVTWWSFANSPQAGRPFALDCDIIQRPDAVESVRFDICQSGRSKGGL